MLDLSYLEKIKQKKKKKLLFLAAFDHFCIDFLQYVAGHDWKYCTTDNSKSFKE